MRRAPLTLALLCVAFSAGSVHAQSLEDRLRGQLTATVAQLRDLQASQATLTAEKDAAERARDGLKAKLTAAEAKLRAARQAPRPEAPAPDLEKVRGEQLAQDQGTIAAAQAENERLAGELKRLQTDHDQLAASLAAETQGLANCRVKNQQAIAVAKDILAAYDHVNTAAMPLRKEPFTGLARVRIQKIEQDFGDRIYDSRLDARTRPPATPADTSPQPK
ncbi:MAG: hypothetical protein P4L64_12580 [Caulobacteraceae bacterium]|nr:hypothetical protein [Caulobacteraceae bacterium]